MKNANNIRTNKNKILEIINKLLALPEFSQIKDQFKKIKSQNTLICTLIWMILSRFGFGFEFGFGQLTKITGNWFLS